MSAEGVVYGSPRRGMTDYRFSAFDADALLREALVADYHSFVRHSWHVIEPGVRFTDGMPIHAVTEHVQALVEGSLPTRNLLINIPPRCMKSTSVSVALVPWVWAHSALRHLKFLYTSYSGDLSNRDSDKTRLLLNSEWYRGVFPSAPVLTSDAVVRLKNSAGGYRIATSVGGKGTGEGGDFIIADDPHNAVEAESDAVRKGTVTWWREAMSTRGNDPKTVRRIVVMQRLHEGDLSGHILAEEFDSYTHLCLPMRYEPQVYDIGKKPHLAWRDARKEGALLWPERFGEPELKTLERSLGDYGTAGQLQQRPAPRGGGLVKADKLGLYAHTLELPDFLYVLQSYDTALTEGTNKNSDPDDTAHLALGVYKDKKGLKRVLVLDAWDEKMAYPKLRKKVIHDWRNEYGGRTDPRGGDDWLHPPRRADNIVVEAKGSGISVIQDLNAANIPVFSYNPGRADKTARLQQVLPLIDAGLVMLLESGRKDEAGKPVMWVRKAVKQWTQFPAGEHDDYVDCLTQALLYLRDLGLLDLEVYEEDEPEDVDYEAQRRAQHAVTAGNPYLK